MAAPEDGRKDRRWQHSHFARPTQAPIAPAPAEPDCRRIARLERSPAATDDPGVGRRRGVPNRRLAQVDDAPTSAAARARFPEAMAGAAGGSAPAVRAAMIENMGTYANPSAFESMRVARRETDDAGSRSGAEAHDPIKPQRKAISVSSDWLFAASFCLMW
jgi:hypothetical protein